MGLEMVEFEMAIEETFELTIPDQDAEKIMTPRHLINFIVDRVPAADSGPCLSQRAFYRLRSVAGCVLSVSPRTLRPTTCLQDLLPAERLQPCWKEVGREIGVRPWPRLGKRRWYDQFLCRPRMNSLGEVARHLVTHSPWTFKDRGEGWTRQQVREVVHGLVEWEFAVKRGDFDENTSFTKLM